IRPMRAVARALVDPSLDELHLGRCQLEVRGARGHQLEIIRGTDDLVELARRGIPRSHNTMAFSALREEPILGVQPKIGVSFVRVWAMTGEAVVGQDR